MKDMKAGYVIKAISPAQGDMDKINSYTRREYKEQEVYTFNVTLCDNEVDRDFEAFTIDTLKQLAQLFVGKTGICDHDRKSSNQCARIYDAQVITDEARRTEYGEAYSFLQAKGYIPRGQNFDEIIQKIESGILKEVSVGCSVGGTVCSVCGKSSCGHIAGKEYGGKKCIRFLNNARDAYEFSFVAVPAQKGAGVTKSFESKKGSGEKNMGCLERIKSASEDEAITLTGDEITEIRKELGWGESYREMLKSNVKRFSRIIQPQISFELVDTITKALDVHELKELEAVYSRLAGDKLPLSVQTAQEKLPPVNVADADFRI